MKDTSKSKGAESIFGTPSSRCHKSSGNPVWDSLAVDRGRKAPTPATVPGLDAGRPLDEAVLDYFEPHFDADLSAVRLHTGTDADSAARRLNARAFTVGSHIGLRGGEFAPHQPDGQKLLAHELTHTVQQSRAPGPATLEPPPHADSRPLEDEARLVSTSILTGNPAPAITHPAPSVAPLRDPATPAVDADVLPDPVIFQVVGDRFKISFERGPENSFVFVVQYEGPYATQDDDTVRPGVLIEHKDKDRKFKAKLHLTETSVVVDLFGDGSLTATLQDTVKPDENSFNRRLHSFASHGNDPFMTAGGYRIGLVLPSPAEVPPGVTLEQLKREAIATTKFKLNGDEFAIGARRLGDSSQVHLRLEGSNKATTYALHPPDEYIPLSNPPAKVTAKIVKNDGRVIDIDVDGDGKADVHWIHTVESSVNPNKSQTRTHHFRSFDKDGILLAEHEVQFFGKPAVIPPNQDEATNKPDLNVEWPSSRDPGQADVPGEMPNPIHRSGGIIELRFDGDGDGSKELLLRLKIIGPPKDNAVQVRLQLKQLSSGAVKEYPFFIPESAADLDFDISQLADGYHPFTIDIGTKDPKPSLRVYHPPQLGPDSAYQVSLAGQLVWYIFPPETAAPNSLIKSEDAPVQNAGVQAFDIRLGPYNDPFRFTLDKHPSGGANFGISAMGVDGPVMAHGMALSPPENATTLKHLPGSNVQVDLDLQGKSAADLTVYDVVRSPEFWRSNDPPSLERDHMITVTGPMSDASHVWKYPIQHGAFMTPGITGFNGDDDKAANAANAISDLASQAEESKGPEPGAKEGDPEIILRRLQGALMQTRLEAKNAGVISERMYNAATDLDQQMIRLRPQAHAGKIDAKLQAAALSDVNTLVLELKNATDDRPETFPKTYGDDAAEITLAYNPYTDVLRTSSNYEQTVEGAGVELAPAIALGNWDKAEPLYKSLELGMDKWIAVRLAEMKPGSDEAKRADYLVKGTEKLQELQSKPGLTRVFATFFADQKYTSQSGIYAKTPLMLFSWHDDSDWYLENVSVPSDTYHVSTGYKSGQAAPPPALFNELNYARHFPKGVLYYNVPGGVSGQLEMTERKSWHEWVSYASLALAAIGLVLAPFGVGVPILATASAVAFALSGATGALAAMGDLIEKAHEGQLTATTLIIDLAQVVASLASMGSSSAGRIVTVAKEADIAASQGIAGAEAWTGAWAKAAKLADQVYVPLVRAGAIADGVAVVALTADTIKKLEEIDAAGGSPEDRKQAKILLLGQLAFVGGMSYLSIKGAMPEIKGGKVNIVLDAIEGIPVARAAGVRAGGIELRIPAGASSMHAEARWQTRALEEAAREGNAQAKAMLADEELMKWYRAWMEQPKKLNFDAAGHAEPIMPKIDGVEPPPAVQKQLSDFANAKQVGLGLYERAMTNVEEVGKVRDAIEKTGGKLDLTPGTPEWKANRQKMVDALGGGKVGEDLVSRYERFRLGADYGSPADLDKFVAERQKLAQILPDTEIAKLRKLYPGYEIYVTGSATHTAPPKPGKPAQAVTDIDIVVIAPENTTADMRQALEARARDMRVRPDPGYLDKFKIKDPDFTLGVDAKVVTPDEMFGLSTATAPDRTPLNYTRIDKDVPAMVSARIAAPPKSDRLKLFATDLNATPPAKTADEAFQQVSTALNKVEDAKSNVPFNPATWETDGRMYPPQADSARPVLDHPDVTRYVSKGHNTFIRQNGAIEIQSATPKGSDKPAVILFSKKGADGKGVWD